MSRSRLAALLSLLMIGGLLVALAGPASASRATESSRGPDPTLGRQSCALMGRAYVVGGCSRTTCAVRGEFVRRSPNAETCLVGGRDGAAYGTEVDARTCAQLHRRWVRQVNFCASNPYRGRAVTTAAPQCLAPFTTYVVTSSTTGGRATRREAEDRADVCLRPQQVVRLQRQARRSGSSLRQLALAAGGRQDAGATGRTVLMVGDSLTWRGTDEIARLRPSWVVDGESGRNLRALGSRLTRFTQTHGEPTGLVIALGTNPAPRFNLPELRTVVDRLDEDVPVMVVTPFRRPGYNVAGQVRAVRKADAMLRTFAEDRPATCVADWRELVAPDKEALVDGTHQTRAEERVWARLISRSWASCAPL